MRRTALLCLLLLLCLNHHSSLESTDKRVVKSKDNSYYLLDLKEGYYRLLPNHETAIELQRTLKYDHVSVKHVIIEEDADGTSLVGLSPRKEVVSLAHANTSPDEKMRVMIQKILALSPTPYWKESQKFPDRLNPAIEFWHDKIVMISRPGLYDCNITTYWLSHDYKKVDRESSLLGIGYGIPFNMKIHEFNQLREDPRLLVLSNDTLVIVYTSKVSLFKPPMQCFCKMHVDPSTGSAVIEDSIQMDTTGWKQVGQKNWIPLEYKNRLLFITSINPMHIVEHSGEVHEGNMGVVKTLYSTHKKLDVPWKAEYGLPLRGGTPAILVHGLYLAFFHTVSHFQSPPHDLRTYFMGAVTFCPVFPFNLHAVSPHPILNESMYTVAWTDSPKIDYVSFPIGLTLDHTDKNFGHVFLSLGHQDKDGYIFRLEIDGLYRSMTQIGSCEQ